MAGAAANGQHLEPEPTQRTRLERAEQALHRVYAIGAVLGGCVLLGILGAVQYGKLAQANEVQALAAKHASDVAAVRAEQARDRVEHAVTTERVEGMEKQLDWTTRTIWEIAKRWRLDVDAPPKKR